MNKIWTLEVKEDSESGDAILEFPKELLDQAGWREGDVLDWVDNKDGSWTLKKKEPTQWVLVEAISTFRHRYMVEVPVGVDQYGKDKSEWALDTVTMEEAKEFSQEHIGEQIVSHRIVTKQEALAMCDNDNDYGKTWDEETKIKNFFTTWQNQNG
jgi:bifunctional DNA-binding transcriptional regulator/antitoxin component of YhaV-PrlF toxin-antitoxin module